jgi:TRAP-type transport system periplasmic protein
MPAPELAKMKERAKPVVEKYTKLYGEPLVKELYAEVAKARAAK